MKTAQKVLVIIAALGLLAAAGCKKNDLSMQRNRIFLMGRLLAGKTCDVRMIWRKAPEDQVPVTVTADLSQIGGDAAQELTGSVNGTWRWSGQVTPDISGERLITITAIDSNEQKQELSKRFRVFNTDRTIALASCSDHLLALKTNGTVAAAFKDNYFYGDYGQCTVPADLTDAVAVAGFGDTRYEGWAAYSLALKQDGTVAVWGKYADNETLPVYEPEGLGDVVAIAARAGRGNALKADGTVVEWGCQTYIDENGAYAGTKCATYDVPDGVTDVVAIASGFYHSLALKADSTVVAWGNNGYGQCDVPIVLRDVVAIAGGNVRSLALKDNGEVVVWGYGETSPVRIGRDFTEIAAGYTSIGLREDGTVVAWWYDEYGISDYTSLKPYYVISGLKNIIAITSDMALAGDGTVTGFSPEWYGFNEWPVPAELQ